MGQPHKHAELIKAWADGAEIQVFVGGTKQYWRDVPTPTWGVGCIYRIKPKTIRYRLYLYTARDKIIVQTMNENDLYDATKYVNFIRWLGDWQEVEI